MKTRDVRLADARTSENQQDMTAVRPGHSADELRGAARKRGDEAPAATPSLSVAGPSLIVCWHDIPWPNTGNWVGMYRRVSEYWELVTWAYTDGQADRCGYLTVPATALPGPYELRIFYDESGSLLATGQPYRVVDYDYVFPHTGPNLPGKDLQPSWAASYPLADYVALAQFGAPDKSSLAHSYLDPVPVGIGSLVVPTGTEPGEYELRLFTDPWVRRATAHLTVDDGTANIAHNKHGTDTVALLPGDGVTVSWSGIPAPTSTDWVGLFPHGATHHEYAAWIYTNGAATGSGTLTIPATIQPGRHELRLFSNNGYHPLAVTYYADDLRIGTGPRLGNYPGGPGSAGASHAGTVVCTWQNVSSSTATDWVGVYHSGADSHDYLAWRYTGGGSYGSVHVKLPAGLPHGDYEVRMFRQNGYTQVAFDLLFL